MSEKTFNSRIVHKHDVESNWLKAINFIPKQGEIIVYDLDEAHDYERLKIGDGITHINDLPFTSDDIRDSINTLVGDTPVNEQINTALVDTTNQIEDLYNRLNSNSTLGFYCVEDVTIVLNGVSTTYPANSNVETKMLDTDVWEIIPTSDNSILQLNAFPGALGTYYSWLEGVKQFSNILFDMNNVDFYSKWSQGNQGAYQVQFAQYINCIFWSDNPYVADVNKRTNYTLYYTSQLPLCYSSIPDNTFKAFFLAFGVNSDPNWGNKAYRESFAKATWATQAFSYYGARTVGIFGHDDPDFNITLPKDCRGLMYDASAIENAGTFDAVNVTNFGAKSGSWRDAFGRCYNLKNLYIKNLKVNLNLSWSPISYEAISFIISKATNTNAITISLSPYTYNLLSSSDFELATSKNITIELLTTNSADDKRFSTVAYKTGDGEFTGDVIAGGNGGSNPVSLKTVNNLVQNKADFNAVLLKAEQTLTEEELTQVHNNLKIVGQNVTGTEYTIDGSTVTAGDFAEVFNNYSENIAAGKYSHAEGYQTIAKGSYAHAEGYGTYATAAATHAEGYDTHATARYSHAEGASTTASGNNSHAEGNSTTSSGHYSHAEGNFTIAAGGYSHAEGNYAQTGESGTYAHAEGSYTKATKTGAHAEGNYTEANGAFSHTEGYYTKAESMYQHVRGKYNIADDTGAYATIIGNGDADSNRKNIHTLDWNGNAWLAGDVYVGSTSGINKDEGSKKLATEEYVDTQIENISVSQDNSDALLKTEQTLTDEELTQVRKNLKFTGRDVGGQTFTIDDQTITADKYAEVFNDYVDNIATGHYSHAEGRNTTASGTYSHAEGIAATASGDASHAEGCYSNAEGDTSHAEGQSTTASGAYSHAEGWFSDATGDYSHAEGRSTTASGEHSHAEGHNTTASGESSHAEGEHTEVSGDYSHAEGYWTIASGESSHAEGEHTEASSAYSHAEGYCTFARGTGAHAEGWMTLAIGEYQHVQGKYNVESSEYAHIVGNGVSEDNYSNAHTLDWDGNAWFAGDVYVGSTSGTDKDEGSKKLATEEFVNNTVSNYVDDTIQAMSLDQIDAICGAASSVE